MSNFDEFSIGDFFLGNEVVLSDPCYEKENGCNYLIKTGEILPGNYRGHIEYDYWEKRVASLIVHHSNYSLSSLQYDFESTGEYLGVDSGQMSIVTASNYYSEKDEWYKACCNLTLNEEFQCGILPDGNGIVSSTGYGDGCYELFFAKKNGYIVGIKIVFIEEEDDEDEYEDDE